MYTRAHTHTCKYTHRHAHRVTDSIVTAVLGMQRQAVAACNPWQIKVTLGCNCTLVLPDYTATRCRGNFFTVCTGADEAAVLWKAVESSGFSWRYELKSKERLLTSMPALPVK